MSKGSKVPISQIGDYLNEEVDRVLRAIVLQTDQLAKKSSPVDTGRFAASWMIGKDDASGKPVKPGNYKGQITKAKGSNYTPGQEKVGSKYYIHNNLPYAEKLAFSAKGSGSRRVKRYKPNREVTTWGTPGKGSSIQTDGPGWTELIVKDMEQISKGFWKDIQGTT